MDLGVGVRYIFANHFLHEQIIDTNTELHAAPLAEHVPEEDGTSININKQASLQSRNFLREKSKGISKY